MRVLRTSLLSCIYAIICLVGADDSIQGICNGIKGLYDCKAIITVPTGAKAKMCPNKFFDTDSCKTKTKYRYPCPTVPKPFRMCDGWTCVPGTREKWIDVPCGVTILTKDVDICASVRGALGNVGQQIITKTTAMCTCLPQAINLVTHGLWDAVKNGNDLSGAVSILIKDIITLQKCMMDNGFDIHDTKAEVMASTLSTDGGYTVLKAAEIDLVKYGELAAALATCAVTCDIDLITKFFTNYLSESQALMTDQVSSFLNVWLQLFDTVKTNVEDIGHNVQDLFAGLQEVPDKVKEVKDKICNGDACLGPVISSFLQNVTEAVTMSKALQGITNAVKGITEDVPKLINAVEATIDGIKAIPEINSIIDLIQNIQSIEDILKVLNVAQDLPKLAKNVEEDATSMVNFVTNYSVQTNKALELCEDIVSTSWASFPSEFTTDSSGNVRAGLAEIQSIIREDITEHLRNITTSFKTLEQSLNTLPVRNGAFNIEMGVASYQRWSDASMDLPCTRQARKTFEVAGFRGSFDYPEFYSCPYGPVRLPWPNHHIPYIKFRVT